MGCSETSVRNCHYSLCNNPEDFSSQLLRGGSVKSRIELKHFYFLDFKLPPCFESCMYSFGYFPGVRLWFADVSEPSISSIFRGWPKEYIQEYFKLYRVSQLNHGSHTNRVITMGSPFFVVPKQTE